MSGKWIVAAAVATTLAFAAEAQESRTAKPGSWERYQALTSNNIFVKDRRPQSSGSGRSSPATHAEAATTERSFVLTGVVQQDGVFYAFVEDTRNRTTMKVRAGEDVCRGKLAALTLDSVDYVKDGATTRVEVGRNFEGTTASAPAATSADASTTPAAPGAVVAPTPGSEAALLERLRQRRLKEMGK